MNYRKYIKVSKDQFGRLERLENRIYYAMRSTSVPELSVDEITALLNGSYLQRPEPKKDPHQIVVAWCEAEKSRILQDWSFDRFYYQDDPEVWPVGTPPDTSTHDSLVVKVKGWTLLEALKVVKIFEEIDALSLTALRITPEGIYKLLEDTRV